MNIAVISNFNFQQRAGGGAGQATFDLAKTLARQGKHQTYFFYPSDEFKLIATDIPNLFFYEYPSVLVKGMGISKLSGKQSRELVEIFDDLNIDIFHSQAEAFIGQFVQKYALNNRKLFFMHLHFLPTKVNNFMPSSNPRLAKLFFKSPLFNLQLKSFLINSTAVIVLNETAKKDLIKFGFKGNVHIVPNPVFFQNRSDSHLTSNRLKKLVYVGFLSERKNQKFLIEVMKYLPKEYNLTLVGSELDKGYRNAILQMMSKHKNVDLIGRIPHENMQKFLLTQGIFVSASKDEVQSLALLEAMMSGLVVLAIKNQTTDEYLRDYPYIFDKTVTPREFAKKVLEINQTNLSRLDALRKGCYQKSSQNAPDNVYKQYNSLYEKYLNHKVVRKKLSLNAEFFFVFSLIASLLIFFVFGIKKNLSKYTKTKNQGS